MQKRPSKAFLPKARTGYTLRHVARTYAASFAEAFKAGLKTIQGDSFAAATGAAIQTSIAVWIAVTIRTVRYALAAVTAHTINIRTIRTDIQIIDRSVFATFSSCMHTGTNDHQNKYQNRGASQNNTDYEQDMTFGILQMIIVRSHMPVADIF